jgi:chaperonin cofactor prefoldin
MKENKIEDVDKVMDEINEHTDDTMRAIQDALGTPLSNSVDEDDLLAELAV